MPFALIPFTLLVIPILEIAVFIVVGNLIGLWPTLGLVVLTAIIGTMLLKRQGFGILARIQAETRQGRVPGRELVDGVMVAVAGVLLLTPGLVTDTLGFLLFVPAVRSAVFSYLKTRAVVVAGSEFGRRTGRDPRHGGFSGRAGSNPDVVDLSGDEYTRAPDPSSPWHEADGEGGSPAGAGPAGPNGRTLH